MSSLLRLVCWLEMTDQMFWFFLNKWRTIAGMRFMGGVFSPWQFACIKSSSCGSPAGRELFVPTSFPSNTKHLCPLLSERCCRLELRTRLWTGWPLSTSAWCPSWLVMKVTTLADIKEICYISAVGGWSHLCMYWRAVNRTRRTDEGTSTTARKWFNGFSQSSRRASLVTEFTFILGFSNY